MNGQIAELWRYPVSSMAGEQLAVARVEADGIAGDGSGECSMKQPAASPPLDGKSTSSAYRVRMPGSVMAASPFRSMAGVGPVRSREKSDPDNGIVYYETPLAKALLGAEEGDEVTVLVGNQVRAAKSEEIIRVAEVSTH